MMESILSRLQGLLEQLEALARNYLCLLYTSDAADE